MWTVAVLVAVTAVLCLVSGGYILQRTAPVVFVLAGLTVLGIWRGRGLVRPPRPYLIGLMAFAALVGWTGLSVLWSSGPDLSWIAFDVAALYLLVMAAVGVLPGGPLQLRLAAYGLALVVLAVSAYAFLGKIVPDVVTHAHVFARLRAPVGYWNVLAALVVMAVPVFLVIASRRESRPWARGLSASALVLLLLTFFFTFSRGGYIAFGAALLIYFLLSTRRLSGLVSLAIPAALSAAVLLHLRGLDTLFAATTDDRLRAGQGHALALWFIVALVLAAAAQIVVTLLERRWTLSPRRARTAGTMVVAALVAVPLVLGGVYIAGHGGGAWLSTQYHSALSEAGPANDVQRLTSLGTSGRVPWYREALRGFSHHPLLGTGAGTFRMTDDLYRTNLVVVKHSHSQWLNLLTELGLVGFALFVVAIGGLMAAAFSRALRDRRDPHRSLLAACQAAIGAFVVHMSIDWDWDMAAITVAFLLLAGVSAAYVRDRGASSERVRASTPAGAGAVASAPAPPSVPSRTVRLFATGVVLFGVVCWALPYLAERETMAAQDQLSRGRVAAAGVEARRAAALNPLSIDPLLALAAVQTQEGDLDGAAATLDRAVRLQPDNYKPYYEMGVLRLEQFGDEAGARLWFSRALELNPMHPATRRILGIP